MRRAFIARLAAFPVSALASFTLTSIIIRGAGAEAYGAVMLVASLFMLMQFVDLGTGAVVVNAFSDPGNTPALRANVAARVARVLVASATAVAVLGWLGTFAWSWSEILGVTGDTQAIDLATAVSITVFALSIPPSIGARLLVGCGRADLSILIAPLGSVASLATGWLLLQTSLDSIWISISMPGGVLISQIISLILGVRVSRLKTRDLFRASTFPVRDVLSSSIPMLVIMATLPFALQSHRIIISHLSTPIELARYSLAMQFYQPVWSFIGAAATPLWPQWSALRGDPTAVAAAFRRALLALGVLGAGSLVGLVVLGDFVAGVMTAHTILVGLPLLGATGLLLIVQALQQAPGMYLTTASGLRFQSVGAVVATVISVGGSILLVPILGVIAPALVTSLGILAGQTIPGLLAVRRDLRRSRTLLDDQKEGTDEANH